MSPVSRKSVRSGARTDERIPSSLTHQFSPTLGCSDRTEIPSPPLCPPSPTAPALSRTSLL
jgi:hypothetical protein